MFVKFSKLPLVFIDRKSNSGNLSTLTEIETVYIRRFIYKILKCVLSITRLLREVRPGPLTRLTTPVGWLYILQLNHLSRFAIGVLSSFICVLGLSLWLCDISVNVSAFVIGPSQVTSFFLFLETMSYPIFNWSNNEVRLRVSVDGTPVTQNSHMPKSDLFFSL